MKLLLKKKKNINKYLKTEICKLKKTFWKYSLKSHLEWFDKYVKDFDIHLLIFRDRELIGYNLMRIRYLDKIKKKKIKFFYFDTLIVKKKYRGLNLSRKIIDKCKVISNKKGIPIILICEKKHINYYDKWGFTLLNRKDLLFQDYDFNKYSMLYIKKNKNLFYKKKLKIHLN